MVRLHPHRVLRHACSIGNVNPPYPSRPALRGARQPARQQVGPVVPIPGNHCHGEYHVNDDATGELGPEVVRREIW